MSLLESPTGHLMNLSRTTPRWDPLLIEDHFAETTLGAVDGIPVAVVDAQGSNPARMDRGSPTSSWPTRIARRSYRSVSGASINTMEWW